MTHEELIAEAREAAFNARMNYSSSSDWLDELADALESATADTEWGVQYEKTGQHAIVHWVAKDEHEARWVANDSFSIMGKVIKRTVGQWEAVE